MTVSPGALVISLDLERFWGVCGFQDLATYGDHVRGERDAILGILALFKRYRIRATWATLGFLFCRDEEELLGSLPADRPNYARAGISTYGYFAQASDPKYRSLFFLHDELDHILDTPGQEVGCHTFSHFYCRQAGATSQAFRADLEAFSKVAARRGVTPASFVFPQNQVRPEWLTILAELGYRAYRGTESSWMFQGDQPSARLARGLDSVLPFGASHSYTVRTIGQHPPPLNLPSSRFHRPITGYRPVDDLRLARIRAGIRQAARCGEVYHLWWHPHNFGLRVSESLQALETILQEFVRQRDSTGMESLGMDDLASRVLRVA
jgi:peptidoglycan/xylan/chitin deacetylase (PgdA/CDA1 family)